jgi:hypothetical protein
MTTLQPDSLDRFDFLLSCPGRVRTEVERGRRVLLLALFGRPGEGEEAAAAVGRLGAEYVAAGLTPVRPRPLELAPAATVAERDPEEEDVVIAAAHLLAEVGSRTQVVHTHAPLGLGPSIDHHITYEASVRAFATEGGRNLFLYEERPEAFVPGAVRTRLALLGARLPPEGASSAPRAGLLRMLWRVNEPGRLREEPGGTRGRLASVAAARRFNSRAAAAAKRMGAVYHAERVWLFLPSGDGLAEVRHPLESDEPR